MNLRFKPIIPVTAFALLAFVLGCSNVSGFSSKEKDKQDSSSLGQEKQLDTSSDLKTNPTRLSRGLQLRKFGGKQKHLEPRKISSTVL